MSVADLGPNRQIYYRRIDGDDALPCLVFLHDALGSSATWRDFPDAVCAGTRCGALVYDRQGHGHSSPLARDHDVHYLHQYALAELPALLANLVPHRNYFLIGHSDGGSIALIHGAARDARVAGIVTEAAHVFVEDVTLDGVRAAQQARSRGELDGLRRYHADKTDAVFAAWANTWLDPAFRHWNIEYVLPSIACPVLVLQGADDPYATPAQAQAIADATTGPTQAVLLEGCAHNPHREARERTLALITRFICATIEVDR